MFFVRRLSTPEGNLNYVEILLSKNPHRLFNSILTIICIREVPLNLLSVDCNILALLSYLQAHVTSDILLLRVQALYSRGELSSICFYVQTILPCTEKAVTAFLHVVFAINACAIIGFAIPGAIAEDGTLINLYLDCEDALIHVLFLATPVTLAPGLTFCLINVLSHIVLLLSW